MKLRITNTLTREKDYLNIAPAQPVNLYVCGITPYDYAHIGHGRVYVTFDILVRLLAFLGHKTTYVRNVTDIDDKLINKATALGSGTTYQDVANRFFNHFKTDLQQLNCHAPNSEPRVTECMPDIIAFVQGLIDKGNAYVLGNDVYFDISTDDDYGKLSGRKLTDLLAGARIEVNADKKNAGDFALWKGNNDDLFWQSPWGYGRPGWHIECSAMIQKTVGQPLDIHGGGMDLIFPHHENEIAQSESLYQTPLSKLWMHIAFVNSNKEKMSKSLGNIVALHNIFDAYDPMILRFFYIQHHYHTPIDFSDQELVVAQTAYKKLLMHLGSNPVKALDEQDVINLVHTHHIAQEMITALCDDLNTPRLLGVIFQHLPVFKQDEPLRAFTRLLLQNVLGLTLQPLAEKALILTPEIEALLQQREMARKAKDWARADKIRDELVALGHSIQDKKT